MMRKKVKKGITLIEILIVLSILGILILIVMPVVGRIINVYKFNATETQMKQLSEAILGNPAVNKENKRIEGGYFGDTGELPPTLDDLVTNVSGVPGWNGPYIENNNGAYKKDGWGNPFVYNSSAGTITSYGSDGVPGGSGYAADITYQIYNPIGNLMSNIIHVYVRDAQDATLTDTQVNVQIEEPFSGWTNLSYTSGYFYMTNVPTGVRDVIQTQILPAYQASLGENTEQYIVVEPEGAKNQNYNLFLNGTIK